MSEYLIITLREREELKEAAAEWFHNKWGVPKTAYLEGDDEPEMTRMYIHK